MANVRVITTLRNARLNAIRDAIDVGAGPGTVTIYSGAQPANADAALSGNTVLAILNFAEPAAPNAAGGVLTFSTIAPDAGADNAGTATWARIRDAAGATVFDCDVSDTGGTGTIKFSTVVFVVSATVQISSFTLTDPAA